MAWGARGATILVPRTDLGPGTPPPGVLWEVHAEDVYSNLDPGGWDVQTSGSDLQITIDGAVPPVVDAVTYFAERWEPPEAPSGKSIALFGVKEDYYLNVVWEYNVFNGTNGHWQTPAETPPVVTLYCKRPTSGGGVKTVVKPGLYLGHVWTPPSANPFIVMFGLKSRLAGEVAEPHTNAEFNNSSAHMTFAPGLNDATFDWNPYLQATMGANTPPVDKDSMAIFSILVAQDCPLGVYEATVYLDPMLGPLGAVLTDPLDTAFLETDPLPALLRVVVHDDPVPAEFEDCAAPPAVTGLTGSLECCDAHALAWFMSATADDYAVYLVEAGTPRLVSVTAGLTFSRDITEAEALAGATYRVVARNECGDSAAAEVTVPPRYAYAADPATAYSYAADPATAYEESCQ